MAFDPQKAQVASQLLRQGLSDEQALRQAGVSLADFDSYTINDVPGNPNRGNFEPLAGPPVRPNIEVAGSASQIAPTSARTTTISQQSTTTSQETVTGGTVTTTRVTPTTYSDTPESQRLAAEAASRQAALDQRSAQLKAQGQSGAQILRDPEIRSLAQERDALKNQSQDARAVRQEGAVSVITTPGPPITEFARTPDSAALTSSGADQDSQVALGQANAISTSGVRVQNTAPAIGTQSEGTQGENEARAFQQTRTQQGTTVNPEDPAAGFVFDPVTGEQLPSDSVQAREILAQDRRAQNLAATSPGENLSAAFDPETGEYGVWDNNRGRFVQTGLTEQQATLAAQEGEFADFRADPISPNSLNREPQEINQFQVLFNDGTGPGDPGTYYVVDQFGNPAPGRSASLTQAEADNLARELNDPFGSDIADLQARRDAASGALDSGFSEEDRERQTAAVMTDAMRERARVQAILANQLRQADSGDWRFKIRLAPGARYLYRGDDGQGRGAGILAPLAITDGVIFPYTPTVSVQYQASYADQALPHSNYKGYFYSGSQVASVSVQGVFTAQDTGEANYLLAVIHFFRSVTKMFYGQNDDYRGAPPPLVFLQGFGAYQFSRHPCVVSSFQYNLPTEVDYIRADVQPITGLNIQQQRRPGGTERKSVPDNVFSGALERLRNAGASKGAIFRAPAAERLGTSSPTYVPTKIEIQLELLPMQTRQQVSQEFNMRDFSSGSLVRKGFW